MCARACLGACSAKPNRAPGDPPLRLGGGRSPIRLFLRFLPPAAAFHPRRNGVGVEAGVEARFQSRPGAGVCLGPTPPA